MREVNTTACSGISLVSQNYGLGEMVVGGSQADSRTNPSLMTGMTAFIKMHSENEF